MGWELGAPIEASGSIDPLAYPFSRPEGGFALTADGVLVPFAAPLPALSRCGGDGLPRVTIAGLSRIALLAIGSNAAPERIAAKIGGLSPDLLPVLPVYLAGLGAFHAGHIAAYGAVPAALMAARGAVARLHLLFVTDEQLAAFDASESLGRNYTHALLKGVLPDGPVLLYRALEGIFAPGGRPLFMSDLNTCWPYEALRVTQEGALGALARHVGSDLDPRAFCALLARDEAYRGHVRTAMKKARLEDGLSSRLVRWNTG